MEPAGIRPEEAVSGPPFSSTGRTSNTPPRRLSTTRVRPWESAHRTCPNSTGWGWRCGGLYLGWAFWVAAAEGDEEQEGGARSSPRVAVEWRSFVTTVYKGRPRNTHGVSTGSRLPPLFILFYGSPAATVEQVRPLRGAVARYGARLVGTRAPVTHALGGWRDSCASLAIPPRTGLSASYSAQLSAVRPRAVRPRAAIMTGVARGTMEERSAGADSRLQARL